MFAFKHIDQKPYCNHKIHFKSIWFLLFPNGFWSICLNTNITFVSSLSFNYSDGLHNDGLSGKLRRNSQFFVDFGWLDFSSNICWDMPYITEVKDLFPIQISIIPLIKMISIKKDHKFKSLVFFPASESKISFLHQLILLFQCLSNNYCW